MTATVAEHSDVMQNQAAPARTITGSAGGSIYIFVLVISVIVSIIGLSSITIARINIRRVRARANQAEAMSLACSAVQAALATINLNPAWRNNYVSGVETTPIAFGSGTISWKLVDDDGNLADDPQDAVRLFGIGRAGNSAWSQSVLLNGTTPMDALNMAIHASGQLKIQKSRTLTVTGAPASTNADLYMDAMSTLNGDVQAAGISGWRGNITGEVVVPSPPKNLPKIEDILAAYLSKATALPYNGDFDKCVLTPARNEYGGGLNGDGLYFLSTANHDVKIGLSRICGTLIIDTGSKDVIIEKQVLLQNYRADYPVLIVIGNLKLAYTSQGSSQDRYLDEDEIEHNFNPPDAPYLGQTDHDQDDVYPSELRGLVHVVGDLEMSDSMKARGVILCDGNVVVDGNPEIIFDPAIPANPPEGYTTMANELTIAPGSWRREALE